MRRTRRCHLRKATPRSCAAILPARGPPRIPFTPGHEWAGEVVALGAGVVATRWATGGRAGTQGLRRLSQLHGGTLYHLRELWAPRERDSVTMAFITPGAYAQYISPSSIKSVNHMPEMMTFREGALVDTAGVVLQLSRVERRHARGTGRRHRTGPIGLVAMRLARVLGASRIIAVGRGARAASRAAAGADVLVNFEKGDPVKAVRDVTNGAGVDEAIECSGAAGTFRQAVEMVRKGAAWRSSASRPAGDRAACRSSTSSTTRLRFMARARQSQRLAPRHPTDRRRTARRLGSHHPHVSA